MKKFLVIFFMLFFIDGVQALEYSEYSDFSEYSDSYIRSDELTDVKTERRYKYYKLEKVLGDYGENNSLGYQFIDKDDYIYTDYSDVSLDKPEEKEGRIIENIPGVHYKKAKDVSFIKIEAVMANMTLSDIDIMYKGEKIDYESENNILNENVEISKGRYIKFNFKEKLELRYLTLSFNIVKWGSNEGALHIYSGDGVKDYTMDRPTLVGKEGTWKGIDSTCYAEPKIFEDFYSEEHISGSNIFQFVKEVTLYKYKDILYRNYNLNRVYYDDYLTMPYEEYIYMDESLYKDFYAKRVRTILPETTKLVEPINNVAISDDENNFKYKDISKTISDKTDSMYNVPKKSLYYPLNINKIDDLKDVNTKGILYTLLPFILILVILILVLSKLYQKKKECVTV